MNYISTELGLVNCCPLCSAQENNSCGTKIFSDSRDLQCIKGHRWHWCKDGRKVLATIDDCPKRCLGLISTSSHLPGLEKVKTSTLLLPLPPREKLITQKGN